MSLNHGKGRKATPELVPSLLSSSPHHGITLTTIRFNVQSPLHGGSSEAQGNELYLNNILVEEIGSRVGRNQTTVMRICDRWMQEGTTDRRSRSHPLQCLTSREDRQIVRMTVTNRSVTSRTISQHIESETHHSVSARNIRHRLLQSGLSARRLLLGLLLTQNHRRLRR
ncbi:transposable element Tcb1 transposase [Trichonephila clavipes]|nr:transposable element Tcb1 transposase [Trichonephila clavipes]